VKIAGESKPTIFVGTAADLEPAGFAGMRKVGVTAGASTPDYDVEAVLKRLRAIG
jgi:4-hydroxy-3-methylbut-2-enyl diphosphate reductase